MDGKYNKLFIMKKNIFFISIILTIIVASCTDKKSKKSEKMPEMSVNVALPVVKNVTLTTNYPGYLQAQKTVNLVARVSGTLEQINFKPGENVKKGANLFVIEPTTYADQVSQAQATLKEGYANLNYTQANYERTSQALLMNAVSQIQVIQAKSNFEQAQANISNYKAALQTAQTNYSYCYVKAPFNGKISDYNYDVGNFVSGSSAPTLATIYKDDTLFVYFSISETEFITFHSNTTIKELGDLIIQPEGNDTVQQFKARLDYASPSVQTSTGTVKMRAIVVNDNNVLKDGMYVRVIFPYQNVNDAILVPDASIGKDQLGQFMYIVNDSSKVEYRPVKVGQLMNGAYRVINSGITKNDRYVTNAILKVKPGMQVKPVMKDK